MVVRVFPSILEAARDASKEAADVIRRALDSRGEACIVAATGNSQLEFLRQLRQQPGINWERITFFHLDEFVGLGPEHPGSFATYLKEHIVERFQPGHFYFINSLAKPHDECVRLSQLIRNKTVDLAFTGIGDNGHLGFNEPPADFTVEEPFLVVSLQHATRLQQLRTGNFKRLEEVPQQAITMSVPQIMRSKQILTLVMGEHKQEAARNCLEGAVSPRCPASVLRRHPRNTWYLDSSASALLQGTVVGSKRPNDAD